ncbi:Dynein assembly factor 6, axonemal [Frankliniella fusca]|uniref:Dynein assembly factor 6, axonemal n=1 Tax=Frankliniella fusca TaxID=407009 RepID=A0AAE1GTP5_9NEOP|nr:Dynein assembly factor 6, axonemal [Frankliniella fusca]
MTDFNCDIRKLAEILKTEDEHSDSDEELPGFSKIGMGLPHIALKGTPQCGGTLREATVAIEKDCISDPLTGPGDIGKTKRHTVGINKAAESDPLRKPADPDAIWTVEEVADQPTGDEQFDPREQPEYEIKYQQAVSPEDVFLQMNGKTAATASCENMIIIIYMKGETMKSVDLNISSAALDIRSPLYRLHLHLPHPVDGEKGKAEWDDKTEILKVTLKMVREFDFLNF